MRKFEAQIVIPNKEEKKVIDKIISDIEKENKISKKRDKERENFIQSFKSFSIGEMGYILERLNQIYCNVKIEEMSK
ncbi:MAG: hypothetical protein KDK36_01735, partial [Leptospiraceae bacterium]|nr:hypothetical protein [Leptospiraceae bacterium]